MKFKVMSRVCDAELEFVALLACRKGLWKLPPLMEILKNRIPQRLESLRLHSFHRLNADKINDWAIANWWADRHWAERSPYTHMLRRQSCHFVDEACLQYP